MIAAIVIAFLSGLALGLSLLIATAKKQAPRKFDFFYQTRVRVTDGFYQGQVGTVRNYTDNGLFYITLVDGTNQHIAQEHLEELDR